MPILNSSQNYNAISPISLLRDIKFLQRTNKYRPHGSPPNPRDSGRELENSQDLAEPAENGPSYPCLHGAARLEIKTLLRINGVATVFKLQDGQDRAPYRLIVNVTDRCAT